LLRLGHYFSVFLLRFVLRDGYWFQTLYPWIVARVSRAVTIKNSSCQEWNFDLHLDPPPLSLSEIGEATIVPGNADVGDGLYIMRIAGVTVCDAAD
jgi:hypothetical protein